MFIPLGDDNSDRRYPPGRQLCFDWPEHPGFFLPTGHGRQPAVYVFVLYGAQEILTGTDVVTQESSLATRLPVNATGSRDWE